MSEKLVIERSFGPISKLDLIRDFKALGLLETDGVMVHVALSKIGWIIGGEVTLIQALMETLNQGTLVLPSQTGNYGDPSKWENPPVPKSWVSKIKDHMPAYDPNITPPYHMGRVSELFSRYPETMRSNHPQASFTAWGKLAKEVVETHDFDCAFGDKSPLYMMLKHHFKVLTIGTDYDTITSMHYAESKVYPKKTKKELIYYLSENKERKVEEIIDFHYSTENFKKIGRSFEKEFSLRQGLIGQANSKLIDMNTLIDHSIQELRKMIKKV
jgi:aminoglycoside 3-N-acetyltransferase